MLRLTLIVACLFAAHCRALDAVAPALPAIETHLSAQEKYLGKPLTEWLADLKKHTADGKTREVRSALKAVFEFGPSASGAIPDALFLFARQTDLETSHLAMHALGAMGPRARVAEPALLAALNNVMEIPVRRAAACRALVLINPGGSAARKAILAACSDRAAEVRREAILGLLILVSPAPPVWTASRAMTAATLLADDEPPSVLPALPPEPPGVYPFPPAIEALRKALLDPITARDAAEVYAALGEPGVEPLLKALALADALDSTPDLKLRQSQIRQSAAAALGGMKPFAARVFPAMLLAAKKWTLRGERQALVRAAMRLNSNDPTILEMLVEVLDTTPGPLPLVAEKSVPVLLFEAGGYSWGAIKKALTHAAPRVRMLGLKVLSARLFGNLEILKTPGDEQLKINISAHASPAPGDWVPLVIYLLNDKDESNRFFALELLNRAGPPAKDALSAIEAIEMSAPRGSKMQRLAALTNLNVARKPGTPQRLTPLDERSVDNLLSLLKEPRATTLERADAAQALRLYADSEPAAGGLLGALNDADPQVRRAAARSLIAFGARAAPGIPLLIKMLDAEPKSRAAAVEVFSALGAHVPSDLVSAPLIGCVVSAEWPDEKDFEQHLAGALKPHALAVVPALSGYVRAGSPAVRARAARALSLLGPIAVDALPALVELSRSANEEEAGAAFDALRAIGSEQNSDTIAYLSLVIRESLFAEWRRRAVLALGAARRGLDPGAPEPLDALLAALNDPDVGVQRAASEMVINLGELATTRKLVESVESAPPNIWTLTALAASGSAPDIVIPRAVEFSLPGNDNAQRIKAAKILAKYSRNPQAFTAHLRLCMSLEDAVSRAAIDSLIPFISSIPSEIESMLAHADPRIRVRAASMINEGVK